LTHAVGSSTDDSKHPVGTGSDEAVGAVSTDAAASMHAAPAAARMVRIIEVSFE
jgi:hypothetical protein